MSGSDSYSWAVNALYDRLDRNNRSNRIDAGNLLMRQYQLETARRALAQDDERRNALSGINSMEDVPGAVPGLLRSGDVAGASNLLNTYSQMDTRSNKQALDQASLQDRLMKLSKEAIPFLRANPQAYPLVRRDLIQQGMNPKLMPDPANFRSMDDLMGYLDQADQALAGYSERLKANTPSYHNVQQGDETVSLRTFPGGREEVVGRGPKWSDREGLSVTLPDGTSITQGGRGRTATGLQPTTQKDVEKDLIDQASNMQQLRLIRERFDPHFATYAGQAKGLWYKIKEKAGAELSPVERDYAHKFYGYRAEAGQMQADIMRRMSGTAVTPTEEARQKTYLVDPGTGVFDGDSPEQVKSKMERFEQFVGRATARLNYIRKNGLSIQNVSLETMDKIIQDRAEVIEGKLKSQGVSRDNIAKQTLRQLSEEFGLVY